MIKKFPELLNGYNKFDIEEINVLGIIIIN